ncbi:MAG: winged helix-turn-helix transcriptional regulator [Paracoccaceae bacterium]
MAPHPKPMADAEETASFAPMIEAVRRVGDGWTLLILWASLNGITRFDTFQRRLGMARNILSNRLSRLVDEGILEKRPVRAGARRLEYRLTEKGQALTPILTELDVWGRSLSSGMTNGKGHEARTHA